jgi:isopentenyldiphosphate isomerase
MELIDIVDEFGNPTGEIVERSIAHKDGIRHRTAHVWIARKVEEKWKVLLQKRAMTKDSFPGRYDTSSAGHIQAGNEPLESAIRELSEELGILAEPEQLEFAGTFHIQYEKEFHNKMFKDNEIAFVYVYLENVDIEKVIVQEEELDCVEWFDLEETYKECIAHNKKFCVPVKGLETAMGYLKNVKMEDKIIK